MKFLVINGPNLNLLGSREPDIYGSTGYEALVEKVKKAAEAMGAHAFTLGKSIFLGQNKLDFSSPEGLGLLAHELLHTSHFGSGDSVDSKEQAAEAMEARVKQAFGSGGNMNLALEKDSDKKTTGMADQRSSTLGTIKSNSVGARPSYDVEEVFDAVCLKVIDLMVESFKRECEREGR